MNSIARKEKLQPYEKVSSIYLYDEPFSLENGLLTQTLKLKRYELRSRFQQIIQELYQELRNKASKL
jgi:long-chain acyl-CoA synthetase